MHSLTRLSVLALLGLVTVSSKQKTHKLAQVKTQAKSLQETCLPAVEAQPPLTWDSSVEERTIRRSEPSPVWEEIVSDHSYVESPASYDVYEGEEYEQSTHSAPSYREPNTRRPPQDYSEFTQYYEEPIVDLYTYDEETQSYIYTEVPSPDDYHYY
jgi:hypothetical protein